MAESPDQWLFDFILSYLRFIYSLVSFYQCNKKNSLDAEYSSLSSLSPNHAHNRSPIFTVPLIDFIDANCLVFDADEENKLCYTEIHNGFRELVDMLLSSNLSALGVTSLQFVEACQRGKDLDVHKAIFEQILAVDDFLSTSASRIRNAPSLLCSKHADSDRVPVSILARQPSRK